MLKVIKSNAIFTLVLLLSISAYASESQKITPVPMANRQAAITFLAKNGIKAAWRAAKATISATCAGLSSTAHVTFNAARNACSYIAPAIKVPFILAKQHLYITGAVAATLALGYVGSKAYKWYARRSIKKVMPNDTVAPANQSDTAQVGIGCQGGLPSVHAVEPVLAEAVQPAATAVPEAQDHNQDAGNPPHAAAAAPVKPNARRRKVLTLEMMLKASTVNELLEMTRSPLTEAEMLGMIGEVIKAAQGDIEDLQEYRQAGIAYYDAIQNQDIPEVQLAEARKHYIAMSLHNYMISCNEDALPAGMKPLCEGFMRLYKETKRLLCSQYACVRNAEQFNENIKQLEIIVEQLKRKKAVLADAAQEAPQQQ